MSDLTINDALRLAAGDKPFATEFLADPTGFKASFNLTDYQVTSLRSISQQYEVSPAVMDINYE